MYADPWDSPREGSRNDPRPRHSPVARVLRLVVATGVSMCLALAATPPAHAYSAAGTQPSGPNGASGGSATEPLTAADRDLLVKVRLAGTWEGPAGRMAGQKGVNRRVREIGPLLASQHAELDKLVIRAASQVGVPLPSQPTAAQQGWLGEMEAASGAEFDQIFIDRLRDAHGKVFPVIANVRSGTRNTVVRKLAQDANNFVLGHLAMLESTGLVDYSSLPEPPQPPATSTGPAQASGAQSFETRLLAVSQSTGSIAVPVMLLIAIPLLLRRMVRRKLAGAEPARYESRHADAPYPPYPPYDPYDPYVPYDAPAPPGVTYDEPPPYPRSSYTEPDDERPRRRLQTTPRPRL
jgi:putative membrane protein